MEGCGPVAAALVTSRSAGAGPALRGFPAGLMQQAFKWLASPLLQRRCSHAPGGLQQRESATRTVWLEVVGLHGAIELVLNLCEGR